MKILTWNINSIRLRLNHLKRITEEYNPDIICLQETKVADESFPFSELESMGFTDIFFAGEKSYNGVAILAKINIIKKDNLKFINNDARHLSVIMDSGIELHNFYIPAGGDEPDPLINQKFAHKLAYCTAIENWFKINRSSNDNIILLGDLNIAPLRNDVWSHNQLLNVVSHTPVEVEHLSRIYESINFVDSVRKFVPETQKLYSWWSYRNQDWKKSNRGRRLDHIWTSQNLDARIKKSFIIKEARDWERPSDHVPVVIELI